jgi:hypothetical protein|tara:strand:+ start:239 stop:730 length:492 start_codon:yes stop_codon:yes gene_type:complete
MGKNLLLFFILLLAVACDHNHTHDGHDHGQGGHNHGQGHHHVAPNSGTLVEFGQEDCHLEFLHDDQNASRMRLLAYKFHPQLTAVKLPMAEIKVGVKVGGEEKTLVFKPVINPTMGNSATHSSEYAAEAKWLAGTSTFEARVEKLEFPGGISHNKTFQFGNKE